MDTSRKKKDKTPRLLKVVRWWFPKAERFAPAIAHRFFMYLFFTPLHYPVPEKEKKALKYASRFTIEIPGKKIQAYCWGAGQPVWLVHGWAGRGTQFRRFVKPLNKAGFQVIGFDGPAHGSSEGKKTSILEFEAVLRKMAEKTGPPVAVIAHSFGGGASLYAAAHGVPIKRLVMIATPTVGDYIINTYLRAINGSPETGAHFKKEIEERHGQPFDNYTASVLVTQLPGPIDLLLVHDADDKEVDIHQADVLLKIYPEATLMRTVGLGHTRILKDDNVIAACVTFTSGQASPG